MTGPRLGQGMPVDDGWVARQLADLQRQITELRAARTLDSSTVSPDGTLTIDGTLDITGNLNVTGPTSLDSTLTVTGDLQSPDYAAGVSGWKLDGASDNAEFNSLTLRAGIVGDAALANPIAVDLANTGNSSVADFPTSYAGTPDVSVTLTIPAGFSRAYVFANAVARCSAATSSFTVLRSKIKIGTSFSTEVLNGSTEVAMSPVTYGLKLTGLAAGSLVVGLYDEALSADPGTAGAYLSAFAVFLR